MSVIENMGLHLQRPLNLLYYGGNVEIMHTRLSSLADNIVFDHDRSIVPGVSVPLIRNIFETGAGPLKKNGGDTFIQTFEIKCTEVGH